MNAADGSFDSPFESVAATLDTSSIGEGRHTLFLRGQDASGSWGAVSAAFFWVLDPATAPRIEGTVTDAGDGSPLAATVSTGIFSTSTDVDGTYSLITAEGTYDITATAPDHAPSTISDVVASTGSVTPLNFQLAPFVVVLGDDVEDGNSGWTADPPWAITAENSSSPSHSWTDSPGSDYATGVDTSLTSPVFALADASGVTLEFHHIYDTESGWDYCTVEYSTDGGSTWTAAASYDGTRTPANWDRVVIDLPALNGQHQARIRFRLTSDSWGIEGDGWHIDDIVLRAAFTPPLFADDFELGNTSRWSSTVP
jgi:hypothetical protein